jgi:uncharacterized RDD family membrane protein YckC
VTSNPPPSRGGRIRRALSQPVTSVADVLVPTLVDAVDFDETLSRVDIDSLVARVDLQALLDKLDLNELLEKVDVDALFERIAIAELIARVDLNELLETVDVDHLLARIEVDRLISRISVDSLIQRVDMDALIKGVDVDAMIERLDVDGLIQKVDVDALVQRVAIDALIQKVDVDGLIQRVDVDALVQRVDLDALLLKVDLDALIDRIDVASLTNRLQLASIVRKSTGGLVMSMLDLVRRQVVGIDVLMLRLVDRVLRRKPGTLPAGPPLLTSASGITDPASGQVSGRYAGPASRLAAFFLDLGVVLATFVMSTSVITYTVKLLTGHQIDRSPNGLWWTIGLVTWWFVYEWIGLAVAGRTVGKALVGLRVVAADGSPLAQRQSLLRVIARALSFILLGIGFIMALFTRDRRALHDRLVRTCVVYDWGDRPAAMPAPLTRWLGKRGAIEPEIVTSPPR